MGPMFTSREEWRELHPAGRRAYLWSAVGHTLQAGVFAVAVLVLVCGALDPHLRSVSFLAVAAASLLGAGIGSYALFRREWRAAERAFATGRE